MWCVTQVIIRLISFLLESLIISLTCYDHTVNWQELCFWSILCPFGHVLGQYAKNDTVLTNRRLTETGVLSIC